MLKLLLVQENAVIHEYELEDGVTLIGRGADNDIRLTDMSVSNHHAEIEVRPNEYVSVLKDIFLTDHDSTNGTMKNGLKVEHCRLAHGDCVQFGSVKFKVEYDEQSNMDSTRIYIPDTMP